MKIYIIKSLATYYTFEISKRIILMHPIKKNRELKEYNLILIPPSY